MSVSCSKSCIVFASCPLLLQLRTWYIDLFFFLFPFVVAQLISWFSSAVIPVAASVNFPVDKKLFGTGRLLRVDEDATLLSVLRVALGDNKSWDSTLPIFTSETGRPRRRPASCLSSHRKRWSGTWAEEARGSGLKLITRGQPSNHTHTRADRTINDVFLATTSENQAARVTVPCSWKVEVGILDLCVKKISAKNKTDRQPVKIWAILVEAETFSLALTKFLEFRKLHKTTKNRLYYRLFHTYFDGWQTQ